MRWTNCGSEVLPGTNFCNNCGANINGGNVGYNNPYPVQKNSSLQIILLIVIIISIVGCFLPYVSSLGLKMNYVYYENPITGDLDLKDGSLLIAMGVASFICLLCKKKVPVLVLQIISLGLLLLDLGNDTNRFGELLHYEVGFYVMLVSLIISVVLAIIRLAGNKKYN